MGKNDARVLLVDADPLCRWALRESLTEAGLQVVESSGDVPLGSVNDIDVLVLDATLPQDGAMDVLQHVRKSNPRCRVILMTAFDDVSLARLQPPSASWRAIQKPFDMNRMMAVVRELAGINQ
jgi:DNA-binding NtrC family response regulator